MEQVGYDTYCKLLDEVIKESKGIKVEEETDITIDINVSSYIPNEYISDNSQKIDVYQKIALCKTNDDIKNIIEDITDRYGKMPKEMMSLISIAEIKGLCKNVGITKIVQKQNKIIYNFEPNNFEFDVQELTKKYKDRIKFSSSIKPYITYTLSNPNNVIEEVKEFLNDNNKQRQ